MAGIPDFMIEFIKDILAGEYFVEIWKDPQTGKIII